MGGGGGGGGGGIVTGVCDGVICGVCDGVICFNRLSLSRCENRCGDLPFASNETNATTSNKTAMVDYLASIQRPFP